VFISLSHAFSRLSGEHGILEDAPIELLLLLLLLLLVLTRAAVLPLLWLWLWLLFRDR